jgi:hypothetical protein
MGSFPFLETGGIIRNKLWIDIETQTRKMFMQSVRIICETIFYIALLGYQNSLNAYYKRSLERGKKTGNSMPSTSICSGSLDHAKEALKNAVDAAVRHTAGEEDKANELALSALSELGER